MKIRSLGRNTDLIFARFSGNVIERDHYVVVQTPSNPTYHWGNYLIFDRAPQRGDLQKWTELFKKEFPYYPKHTHMLFTWDTEKPDAGDNEEFLQAGFKFDTALVLTTAKVKLPPKYNPDIEIRKIKTDAEWEMLVQNAVLVADLQYFSSLAACEDFERRRYVQYRKMSEQGLGNWFGAFLKDKLVGDLGLFFENGIGRYQNVCTHPDFRRQGICGTLVYETAKIGLKEFEIQTLVMEADADYHAARIYESVGFRKNESNHSLSWWNYN